LANETDGFIGCELVDEFLGFDFGSVFSGEFAAIPGAIAKAGGGEIEAALFGGITEVPLPGDGGAIAGLLKELREGDFAFIHAAFSDGGDSIGAIVSSGERDGAAGRTDGERDEGILETGSLSSEAIEVGSFEMGVAGAAHGIGAVVIGKDEDDVWLGVAKE
jgi:hypothetical protein